MQIALLQRNIKAGIRRITRIMREYGCILHSDRGSLYTSDAFRETLSKAGVAQSLSGVDHCYDSTRMEKFFAKLKIGAALQNANIKDEERKRKVSYFSVHIYLL